VDSLKEQMIRYIQPSIVNSTIKQLKQFSHINWKKPDFIILIAPKGGQENQVIKAVKNEFDELAVAFLSLNFLEKTCKDSFRNQNEKQKCILLFKHL